MTPREFLELVVRPNVAEFHANYADLRHAQNALASVDALAAHLYHWGRANATAAVPVLKNEDTEYRETLASRNQEFRLLRDIAKAQKHVRLTRCNPLLLEASQVTARPIGYGEGPYGMGRYDGPPQIVVDLAPGPMFFVESVVDRALAFLEAEMTSLGA